VGKIGGAAERKQEFEDKALKIKSGGCGLPSGKTSGLLGHWVGGT
jgi:hypothetical protein